MATFYKGRADVESWSPPELVNPAIKKELRVRTAVHDWKNIRIELWDKECK
jgi:hypothetical protein